MKITVVGLSEAKKLIPEGGFDACVSIADPDSTSRPKNRHLIPLVLDLDFSDVGITGDFPPVPEDARRLVFFLRRIVEIGCTNVVIHCFAGISRSTAAALALLALVHGKDADLAGLLLEIRPQAFPNEHFASLLDDEIGWRTRPLSAAATKLRADSTAPILLLDLAARGGDR